MIRRLGYLDTENDLDKTDTGFFTDDEDIEESKEYECDSLVKGNILREVNMRYRYGEFNRNALDSVWNSEHKYKTDSQTDLDEIKVNSKLDLIRQKTARDPAGRGSKMFREILRGNVTVINPSGEIVKKVRKGHRK